jgi:crotonobetainyl-CoA:carnitine CoA-transferase CaiB-like acyl-CoA transferase
MCKVMGNPDWCKDEKFSDQFSRWKNQDELNKLVGSWTKDFTNDEVMHMLQKAGVAAGSSLDIGELVHDPHVVKRGAIIQQQHSVAGEINVYRAPWKSALTAKNPPAPLLGEHNDYVFKTLLGMSDSEIAKLTEQKVIY